MKLLVLCLCIGIALGRRGGGRPGGGRPGGGGGRPGGGGGRPGGGRGPPGYECGDGTKPYCECPQPPCRPGGNKPTCNCDDGTTPLVPAPCDNGAFPVCKEGSCKDGSAANPNEDPINNPPCPDGKWYNKRMCA